MTPELIKVVGNVLGIILAIPFLVVLFKIAMFAGEIKVLMRSTAEKLDRHIIQVESILEDYGARLLVTEKQVAVLWDGKGRRATDNKEQQA
jgi:hypothetical protein